MLSVDAGYMLCSCMWIVADAKLWCAAAAATSLCIEYSIVLVLRLDSCEVCSQFSAVHATAVAWLLVSVSLHIFLEVFWSASQLHAVVRLPAHNWYPRAGSVVVGGLT